MPRRDAKRQLLQAATAEPTAGAALRTSRPVLRVTIGYHPDVRRIGETSSIDALGDDDLLISRVEPEFRRPRSDDVGFPLADPCLSRRPVILAIARAGGATLTRSPGSAALVVDGQPVDESIALDAAALDRGTVFSLADRVVLVVQRQIDGLETEGGPSTLIGENAEMHRLRTEIVRVADMSVPILLRGESGSGKEVVAQAIHQASTRAERPCVCVNMAAIHPSVAASELFGHVKGAFTGAAGDRDGYFSAADGGTLFLDEIGDTPNEVQPLLLRTLETGIVQRIGSRSEEAVDVRMISATDANLEEAVSAGTFRLALHHRLAGYEIQLPPLRARRDDIGRLLIHFLRQELQAVGRTERLQLAEAAAEPWLPAAVASVLIRADWPGNVRQLRNVVRRMVVRYYDALQVMLDSSLEGLLGGAESIPPRPTPAPPLHAPAEVAPQAPAPAARRRPSSLTDDEVMRALEASQWQVDQAAEQLNVTRGSLYLLIEKSPHLRTAKDVPDEELQRCFEETDGDFELMSQRLKVSKRGLRRRMKRS